MKCTSQATRIKVHAFIKYWSLFQVLLINNWGGEREEKKKGGGKKKGKKKRERPEGKQETGGGDVDVDREHRGLKLRALEVGGIRRKGKK